VGYCESQYGAIRETAAPIEEWNSFVLIEYRSVIEPITSPAIAPVTAPSLRTELRAAETYSKTYPRHDPVTAGENISSQLKTKEKPAGRRLQPAPEMNYRRVNF
jgi:hypothetical protein